ncbi:hypothetical protein [Ferruginibacter albus]|uniref:hypothetical protein n=1 Tax=Ferruginibacter albus TaxID=2875540 RepID=UPI001CC64947|nr:hypothetical protein [Ferruginibacter albus]UAY51732.1 hypothetical protein K9M53_14190 [Ferruginibacter albus]
MKYIFPFIFSFIAVTTYSQTDVAPYYKGAIKKNRETTQRNIIGYINRNLSLPIADSTEDNWEGGLWAMELLQYKSPWLLNRVHFAFDTILQHSIHFQKALLELVYANYPNDFVNEVKNLIEQTADEKVFALCAEYLRQNNSSEETDDYLWDKFSTANNLYSWYKNEDSVSKVIFIQLSRQKKISKERILAPLLDKKYLKKNVVAYSIQRKNRNYPGIVIIKNGDGNFVTNDDGTIFNVPQLARSVSNLPFYITNGNTPQGVFRMHGFDVSKADFIGPTKNIQLTMPFETSLKKFFNDSTITDSAWTEDWYKKILPGGLKEYQSLYQTYYAGAVGRTEIIAHGTTINPEYYKEKTFYPLTPTQGCLCTKEIWSDADGHRQESDQQKLADAIKRAGGAEGYYIVIEIDDQQKPVQLEEVLQYIK